MQLISTALLKNVYIQVRYTKLPNVKFKSEINHLDNYHQVPQTNKSYHLYLSIEHYHILLMDMVVNLGLSNL